MNVIPAVDLKGGRCVRLLHGDFARETLYSDDPVAVARRYRDGGLKHLHLVDLDGALAGDLKHAEIVSRIVAATGLTVQLGGGIRRRENIAQWLAAGISRCIVGSVAIRDPDTVCGWLDEFGAERIVLALDVRMTELPQPLGSGDDGGDGAAALAGTPVLASDGWTRDSGLSLWECLERFRDAGARHILCTDIGRDGAMTGPNLPLYGECRRRYPELRLQASGGVRHLMDLRVLRTLGCAAAITGRALLDGRITLEEAAQFRHDA